MKYALLLFCLLTATPGLLAQKSKDKDVRPPVEPRQHLRTELPLEYFNSEVQVQPLAEDSSVVLLVEKDGRLISRAVYYFQKFDYQLRPGPTVPLEIPRGYEFQRLCAEGTNVYALFSGPVEGTLWLAAYDTRTGELATNEFKTKRTRQIHSLTALDGNLFATVEVDQHLTVLLLNPRTAQFQFLPSVYEPLPARFTLVTDSTTRRAELILSENNGFKSRLQLKQLDTQGQLVQSEFVQAGSDRGLLDAQLSSGDSAARVLAGTYTLRDSRYSQGLFAADLTAGTTVTGQRRSLRFYDFLNFKHFFDFMKPAQVARLRQRQAKLREASRQKRHRYQLLMHDMLPTPSGFVLVAEVYYARYTSGSSGLPGGTDYGNLPYNLPYNPSRFGYASRYNSFNRPASGYHFSHAIVCGFDRQGQLLWDNSFLLDDINRFQLAETTVLRPLADGRMVLAYLKDDKLYYKLIDQTAASPNDWQVRLRTAPAAAATSVEATNDGRRGEKTINTSQEQLLPWYGSHFLAVGYHSVRPEHGQVREVFFLNGLAF